MTADASLGFCDREPIHIPGTIQPHGLMLVVDAKALSVRYAAGNVRQWLRCDEWCSRPLAEIAGEHVASMMLAALSLGAVQAEESVSIGTELFDVRAHRSGEWGIVELERAFAIRPGLPFLSELEAAASAFERAIDLREMSGAAAVEFRRFTGYDRVMIYRFLDDDAGVVLGEDIAPGSRSFLNHHFPAADIPKQARALYVRNLVRVIPDVSYSPAPLVPQWETEPLDMSDAVLRSVSPIHVEYLKNMGVGASASFSIVKDGVLWGLVACHNETPSLIPASARAACRTLAGIFARQVKSREETDAYRERVRLRAFEDDLVALLSREGSLDIAISNHISEFMKMLAADGVAVRRGAELVTGGQCPSAEQVRKLAAWSTDLAKETVFATDQLSQHVDLLPGQQPFCAGLLAITLSEHESWNVLWFRAEQVELVRWAGNPHKNVELTPSGRLTPRASFDAWQETVHGHARPWTLPEIEAANRLRTAVFAVWQNRRIHDLNRELMKALEQKDQLIKQKDFLVGEVNHRVQNSLQLVSSFLSLQARASKDPALQQAIEEAKRRIFAVSLVHRRLYRSDQIEAIDVGRHVDELLTDLVGSIGAEWKKLIVRDLQPVMMPTDRAISVGLIVTELVINANKYAYGGAPGPLRIALTENRTKFRLLVEDSGVGRTSARKGFGTQMMDALVSQLGGIIEYEPNHPGTRAILTAPIQAPSR